MTIFQINIYEPTLLPAVTSLMASSTADTFRPLHQDVVE